MTTIYSYFSRSSDDYGITFIKPSLTQQHFKDECDINSIMDRYNHTGLLPQIVSGFEYGDYSEGFDYQSAMHDIMTAEENFMNLPAKIRKEFDNNPAQLLAFLSDPSNIDRAVELGLVTRPIAPVDSGQVGSPGQAPQGDTSNPSETA